jgi:hypothetical protein
MRRIKWSNPLQKFNSVVGVCIVFIFLHGVSYGNPVGSLKVDRTQSKTEPCTTVYTAHRTTKEEEEEEEEEESYLVKVSMCTVRKGN